MNEILNQIETEIKKVDNDLISLNESAIEYTNLADEYQTTYSTNDATFLKKKMKDAVMRAAPYDI